MNIVDIINACIYIYIGALVILVIWISLDFFLITQYGGKPTFLWRTIDKIIAKVFRK